MAVYIRNDWSPCRLSASQLKLIHSLTTGNSYHCSSVHAIPVLQKLIKRERVESGEGRVRGRGRGGREEGKGGTPPSAILSLLNRPHPLL